MKHLPASVLRAYALGTADLPLRALAEAHLQVCNECEKKVAQLRAQFEPAVQHASDFPSAPLFDSICGALKINDESKREIPDYSSYKDEYIISSPASHQYKPVRHELAPYVPASVLAELPEQKQLDWVSMWPTEGRIAKIAEDESSAYSLYCVHFAAGSHAPRHLHMADEQTVILKGGYTHSEGHINEGDWDLAPAGSIHAPSIDKGSECWCLVRIPSQRAFRFSGISAWREPLIKISQALEDLKEKKKYALLKG